MAIVFGITPAPAAMSCTAAFTDILFGSFDVLAGAQVTTTGSGSISCTGASANTTYRFCINLRGGTDVVGNQRNMISGSYMLPFNMYQDPGYTVPWGNWPAPFLGGGEQLDLTSNGSGQISGTVTVYANVPGGQQNAIPNSYTEYQPGLSTQNLQYGAIPSDGSCPVGGNTALFTYYVRGTVLTNCNVSTIPLNFGSNSSFITANIPSTGTIIVQCTNTTPYSVGLSNGQYANGSQRRMNMGVNYIAYQVYTDSGYSNTWLGTTSTTSCTSGASTCVLGTGSGSNQNITVYGRVPPQPSPAIGTYSDILVVTVTY